MRILLVLLLALALAMAGCSSKSPDKGDSSSSSSSTSSSSSGTSSSSGSSSSSGTPTGGPSNRAPSGALAASSLNGTLPLQVNFTLSGSDPDDDALSWTLAFGDGNVTNGTALPATASHSYGAAGNYSAIYVLSDGKLNATYNVTIQVLPGGGAAFTAVFTEGQDFPSNPLNSAMIPNVGYAGGTGCVGFWDGTSGVDCVFFELEAAWKGKAFTATADTGNPDLEFWPACDPSEVFAVAGYAVAGPESGTIPDGALCVVTWNGAASAATPVYTFTVV